MRSSGLTADSRRQVTVDSDQKVAILGGMSQNVLLSMPAPWFQGFSKEIAKFNRRTDKVNASLKKAKYQKVTRFPTVAQVRTPGHPTDTVTVCVAIKDRSKVLWQELTEILDHFRDHSFDLDGRRVATTGDQKTNDAKPQASMMASAIAATSSTKPPAKPPPWMKPCAAPAKAISSPIQAPSRQWGLWVPCESEEAARAAAGFLQAIAKVGQPQVECRG